MRFPLGLALLFSATVACDPPIEPTSSTDTTDATDDTDAAPDPFAELPAGEWSYVAVDGMICGNGADTGVGVNPGSDLTRTVVVVQGGGACWDTLSCYVLKSTTYVESGWGAAQLQNEVRPLDTSPLFDRADSDNPWADATFVFVPYCTGDLHSGRSEGHYDPLNPARALHHAGDANMAAVTELLAQARPDTERAWAVGFSAGGYGVQLQADRLINTWPQAEVALMADCSPMVHPRDGRWGLWKAAWKMRLPEDCTECETSMPAVIAAQADRFPDTRIGLIATRSDDVISLFFSYGPGTLGPAVNTLATNIYEPRDSVNAFVVDGTEHVLLGNPDRVSADGTRLGDWFGAWRDDSDEWVEAR